MSDRWIGDYLTMQLVLVVAPIALLVALRGCSSSPDGSARWIKRPLAAACAAMWWLLISALVSIAYASRSLSNEHESRERNANTGSVMSAEWVADFVRVFLFDGAHALRDYSLFLRGALNYLRWIASDEPPTGWSSPFG